MIKKVICLGLIVMMVLVVVGESFGVSSGALFEAAKACQSGVLAMEGCGMPGMDPSVPVVKAPVKSSSSGSYNQPTGSSSTRTSGGSSVSQPQYSDVKFWYEGTFHDLGRKNWGDKIKIGDVEFTVGQGYVYPSTHTGAISYGGETGQIPSRVGYQFVGVESNSWLRDLPKDMKKGLEWDFDKNGEWDVRIYYKDEAGTNYGKVDINPKLGFSVDIVDNPTESNIEEIKYFLVGKFPDKVDEYASRIYLQKLEAELKAGKGAGTSEGVETEKPTSSTDARLPEPPTGTSSPITDNGISSDLDINFINDLGDLYNRASTAEREGNLDLALKLWKEIEKKGSKSMNNEVKALVKRAKENAKILTDKIENMREQQGIANTAGILKGRLWSALNGFFGDYSFGVPSKVCQSVFNTAPAGESLGFMDIREPEDYKFKNNVATIQGYKSDYSYKEVKRYVYEVSYSLYAGEENLAYGVFFAGENVFMEQGDVNLGDVKRGYFVKESEKEYKSVCMKYSSGSICGNLREG